MDKKQQLEKLIQESHDNSHDKSENTFYQELKDQQKLLEYELREEQRLLNNLPGRPPGTFGLGSHCRIRYKDDKVPAFTAELVAENVIPDLSSQEPTKLSIHSALGKVIYGKISGTYRVVVGNKISYVEVEAC